MNLINVFNYLSAKDSLGKYINGGATYNINTHEFNPNEGYIVALVGYEKILDMPADLNEWTNVMEQYLVREVWDQIAEQFNIYLGFWINDDGKLVIDVVEKIMDWKEAILKGKERDQVAIWDAYNKQVIYTY